MKTVLAYIGAAIAGVALIAALSFGANALHLANFSFWAPKFEEANRKVVQQSIRRQEGVSEGISALCLNMRLEKDPNSRKAFANMIVVQAGATGTVLSAEAERCSAEAERELGL